MSPTFALDCFFEIPGLREAEGMQIKPSGLLELRDILERWE